MKWKKFRKVETLKENAGEIQFEPVVFFNKMKDLAVS